MKCKNSFRAVILSAFAVGVFCVLPIKPAHTSGSPQAANGTASQSPAKAQPGTAANPAAAAKPGAPAAQPAPAWQGAQADRLSHRGEMYYQTAWGVDDLHVKAAESGELVRFTYRVLDPEKAKILNDEKAQPELFDAQARVKLVIPQMENIGKLRQTSTPKAGMTYWMAFSNPTHVVRRGHHVDIVIGAFRANNLAVE